MPGQADPIVNWQFARRIGLDESVDAGYLAFQEPTKDRARGARKIKTLAPKVALLAVARNVANQILMERPQSLRSWERKWVYIPRYGENRPAHVKQG